MALEFVTARARTRGKSPQEFTYQAVGRLKPRYVQDKDGNPILVDSDNKVVADYAVKDKDGQVVLSHVTQNEDGTLSPAEGYRFIEVDDVVTGGLTENLQDVLDLFGSLTDEQRGGRNVMQMVIESALDGMNYQMRKNAAPETAPTTKDDALARIVTALIAHDILPDEKAGTQFRRAITQAAGQFGQTPEEFVTMSPQYKKLQKVGGVPELATA